jgi:serine/threonine protein kinase
MKICPSCKAKYPDDAVACGHCGARLMVDTSATLPDPRQHLMGKVISGSYKIEKFVGQGGMGAVFQAKQLSLDRNVAVKFLSAALAMDREILERFQREARAASNIGHPGIVQVIDMGYMQDGQPFMVMEMLEGEDLRHRLKKEGPLEVSEAITIMLQVCEALAAAHDKGIVHRDLKPDNIFLVPRKGKAPLVKILDFGLSKIKSGGPKLTNTGTLLGTPNYMAPEQVTGEFEVDHRADIYGAGVILYEMLTGRMAYDGPSVQSIFVKIMTENPAPPRAVRPDIPGEIEDLILKAMARTPAERYADIGRMANDLVRIGSGIGIPRSQLSIMPEASPGAGLDGSAASPWTRPQARARPATDPHAGQMTGPAPYAPAPGAGQGATMPAPGHAPYSPPPQPATPYSYGYRYGQPSPPPVYPSADGRRHLPAKASGESKGLGTGIIIGIIIAVFVLFGTVLGGCIFLSLLASSCQGSPM